MIKQPFIKDLETEITNFNFFQLLRLLEALNVEKTRIGYAAKLSDDYLRLGQAPSMAFSCSTFADAQKQQEPNLLRLQQLFFGVFGPNGPLPLHLTEYASERIRHYDDESFARFADVFHHRLLSFFYRAWADAKAHVNRDRPEEDRFSKKLATFFGKRTQFTANKDEPENLAQCFFSGHFATQTRNEEGLVALISSYFNVPVEIKQFVGQWVDIPEEEKFRLSDAVSYGSLGQQSTLGERVWDCQSKFTLVMGPLTIEEYRKFLPGTADLNTLQKLVKDYLGNELDWDVQLLLKPEEVQPLSLGGLGHLGWTTWIPEDNAQQDFDEFYLSPQQELTW